MKSKSMKPRRRIKTKAEIPREINHNRLSTKMRTRMDNVDNTTEPGE